MRFPNNRSVENVKEGKQKTIRKENKKETYTNCKKGHW